MMEECLKSSQLPLRSQFSLYFNLTSSHTYLKILVSGHGGLLTVTSFFGYFVKRGYQRNKGHNIDAQSFVVSLRNMGVNEQQCNTFIGRLWHNSRPRKVVVLT
jgi:hypothetical protein